MPSRLGRSTRGDGRLVQVSGRPPPRAPGLFRSNRGGFRKVRGAVRRCARGRRAPCAETVYPTRVTRSRTSGRGSGAAGLCGHARFPDAAAVARRSGNIPRTTLLGRMAMRRSIGRLSNTVADQRASPTASGALRAALGRCTATAGGCFCVLALVPSGAADARPVAHQRQACGVGAEASGGGRERCGVSPVCWDRQVLWSIRQRLTPQRPLCPR
jgi:hypothetical protein